MKLPPQTPIDGLLMEPYDPQPFEQRASQKLGMMDAAYATLKTVIVSKAGFLMGYFGAKQAGYEPLKAQNIGLAGGMAGGYIEAYQHWAKQEKFNLNIGEMYQDYRNLHDVLPTDDTLLRENRIYQRMIDHMQQQQPDYRVRDAEAAGQLDSSDRPLQKM